MDLSVRRMAHAREGLRNHLIDCRLQHHVLPCQSWWCFRWLLSSFGHCSNQTFVFQLVQISLSKMHEFQDGTLPSKDRPHLPLSSPKSPYTTTDIACVAWRKAHITANYDLIRLRKKSMHHEMRKSTGKLSGRCHHGLSLCHDSYQNMTSSVRRRKGVYLSPPARPHHHKLPHVPSTC